MAQATKIFISCSGEIESAEAWIKRFKSRVCELSRYESDEVYYFKSWENAPLNAKFRTEVQEGLDSADHLICLVSDQYLESVCCLEELWHYLSRIDEQKSDPIFVFTPFLNKDSYEKLAEFKKHIRLGVNKMKGSARRLFEEKPSKLAEQQWTARLVDARQNARHVKLRSDDDWPYAESLLKPVLIRPKIRSLLDYAALSAYCLGADRYKSGGWGFSLAEVYSYDSEDGEELPKGSYGLNVVVLRALSNFLSDPELNVERNEVFGAKAPEKSSFQAGRNPFQAVKDRLPYFARLLACLEKADAALGFLDRNATDAHDSLAGSEPESRWTLENFGIAHRSDEYHVAVLACLSIAKDILEDRKGGLVQSTLAETPLPENFENLEIFRDLAMKAIKRNDLFELLRKNSDAHQPADPGQATRASTIWLMLAGCSVGVELLSEHIGQSTSLAKKEVQLIEGIRDSINQPNHEECLTMSLAACAAITACDGKFPERVMNVIYENLFESSEGVRRVPGLNCVAWAAILLITFHEAKLIVKPEISKQLWKFGLDLRKEMLTAVTQYWKDAERLSDSNDRTSEIKKNLEAKKRSLLEEHACWWVKNAPTCSRGKGTVKGHHATAFVDGLVSASFWGSAPAAKAENSQPAALSGVLRVNLKDSRIQLDSPGYSRIFLHPFSVITGMKVYNLNGIRRQFGEFDAELVRIMGETVVEEVFVRSGNGYVSIGRKFIEQTNKITADLRGITEKLKLSEEPESGIDDLLKVLREDGKDTRWIHRSAIVQRPRRPNAEPVISWRFVEMPSITAALVVGAK